MIVLVTTADTELIALAAARLRLPAGCAEVMGMSCLGWTAAEVRARLEPLLPRTRCVAVRLLGGRRALPEAVDAIATACAAHGVALVAWPGDLTPDAELSALTTLDAEVAGRGFAYLVHGGDANVAQLVRLLSDATCGTSVGCDQPRPVPWDGRYHPDAPEDPGAAEAWWRTHLDPGDSRPVVGLVFYRAHWMTGNLALVDALCAALEARGCRTLPVFCYSLRTDRGDPAAFAHLRDGSGRPLVDVLVSTLSFAMGELPVSGPQVAAEWSAAALVRLGVPVVQAIAATASREQWQRSDAGLSPVDVVMNVALPEFDGRIVSVPVSFKERVDGVTRYVPDPERVRRCAGLCARLARLRRLPRAEVRLAVVLSSYPTKNSRVGNAVGLDTPASAVRLLGALRAQGYDLGDGPLPDGGDALMRDLLAAGGYDREYLTAAQLAVAPGHLTAAEYARWFEALPASAGAAVRRSWGEPPGRLYAADGRLAFAGLRLGNVLVCIQPPRGFGEDPAAIYHSPDLPPSHHYLGFHSWLNDGFGADAVVHLGKHGTMEWLPGKALGLSAACFPDLCIADLPLFYPFVVNDPGEGTQAKRRAHAVVIDHLIPPVSTADAYGPIVAVEQLMDEYFQAQALDPERLPLIQERIWEEVRQAHLDADLSQPSLPDDFDAFLLRMDGYLCELKDAQIRNGLHVLGVPPDGEALIDMMLACARPTDGGVPGLEDSLAAVCGLDHDALLADRGAAAGACPDALLPYLAGTPRVAGDLLEAVRGLARTLVVQLAAADFDADAIPALLAATVPSEGAAVALEHLGTVLWPALRHTSDEIGNLLLGLRGGHVPAGPSGAPTRGMTHVLPTGRNFYSVDPKSLPTETSWRVGRRLAEAVVERHVAEVGAPPRTVGIVVWGTSAMRTGGDDIAQALALLGVRPLWNRENRRVRGLEPIALGELGRPRVDVVLRVSGFFRDAFPNLVHLFDEAVELVSGLDEDAGANPIAARVRDEFAALVAGGLDPATAAERARYRIFGSRPGAYGAGVLPLLDAGNWQTDADIAAVYTAWGAHAYTRERYGVAAEEQFRSSFSRIAVAIKNQDNREHDIFDSDDYLQYHGGMIACVRALTGTAPRAYFGDSADPARARVRDLAEEARRVFRARVVNPKWLAAMRRHGYKGAFEMAATVDYLYGYDATAGIVDGWMYAQVADDYVLDAVSREFVRRSNPWALKAMAERLLEAAARGLWDDADEERLRALRAVATEVDAELEAQMAPAAGGTAVSPAAPVVLIAHGTRDPEGREELRALAGAVAAGTGTPVRCGVVEYPAEGLEPVFTALAAAADDARRNGASEVRLVPLLLFPAGHARDDLAVAIRGARLLHPDVAWRCVPLLRPAPALLAALGERVRAADARLGEPAEAVVVVGRGSSVAHANRQLERLVAGRLAAADGRPVAHAFASLAAPAVAAALERLRDTGVHSAVVAPYLLNQGLIARRIRREAGAAATRLGMRVEVAEHLGLHPALLGYLRARARGERGVGVAAAAVTTPLRPAAGRMPRPIVVAGCASGTGKSTLALGLMAAFRARGLRVQPFKVGPDYIDPLHHNAVARRPSRNLDSVLCDPRSLPALATRAAAGADVSVVEGVLGLFDGRLGGGDQGSTAEVARLVDGVVVLVVDAARAARSVGAVALGFARFDPRLRIDAVVLNRTGSERHARTATEAVEAATGIPVLGCIPRDDELSLPERYLGLVPPQERPHPPRWAERLGATVERSLDLDALLRLAASGRGPVADPDHDPFALPVSPPRARLAVARDAAFSFLYADALDLLAARGAELVPFSPLVDPGLPDCDALWLPGGFPERFAATLSANLPMRASVAAALGAGMPAVAECGGAMYLGTAITTEDGERHPMCGVLPYGTRMGARRSLGYRTAAALRSSPLVAQGGRVTAHEFHWSAADPGVRPADAAWSVDPGGAAEGHATATLLASYLHLHLCGIPAAAARLVAAAERHRRHAAVAGPAAIGAMP